MSETQKLRVATIVGTRPEIIRLSRVLPKLDHYCQHSLIHTGQNYDYELNEIFFEDLRLRRPDFVLSGAGNTGAETIGKIIIAVDEVLAKLPIDALLVLGDTNSCLSVIPAKRRKIPIFHMEAGNRCFDQRVPEEINRRIVDHTADINLTYSTIAREYLLREGLNPDKVIKIGSPMYEVLQYYQPDFKKSTIRRDLQLSDGKYFVVSAHREENIESELNFKKLICVLNAVAERYNYPVIVSTHPRTRKKIDAFKIPLDNRIQLLSPLGFFDYVRLQTDSFAVISDSGTINEEASILNFRALNIREAHERPEGMEEAIVMMVGLETERILQALQVLESQPKGPTRTMGEVRDYSVPNVSEKVLRIIHSYTDYIKKNVWKQY